MEYDPIKDKLGKFFDSFPAGRKIFYQLLDLILLRAWHVHREMKPWFKKNPSNAQILDAGSGFGQYSFYIASRSPDYKILAVDVKEDYLQDCKEFFGKVGLNNVTFQVDDLVTYRKENFYDLIVSVDVMEHILEDREVFANFHASMKEGALLIINTPSNLGHSIEIVEEHVRDGYVFEEIVEKLTTAGFKNVVAKYSYGTAGHISWKLSMNWPMRMMGTWFGFVILLPFYYLLTYPIAYILNWIDTNSYIKRGTGLTVTATK